MTAVLDILAAVSFFFVGFCALTLVKQVLHART
jgi:hypothetical protein